MILERLAAEPARRAGGDSAARRLRGPLLRLRRDALRPEHPRQSAARASRDACHHPLRQVAGGIPHRPRLPASLDHRADDLREPRPDRRVLLHPCRTWCLARPHAERRPRPHPRRRHHFHRAQPRRLRPRRPPCPGAGARHPKRRRKSPTCSRPASAGTTSWSATAGSAVSSAQDSKRRARPCSSSRTRRGRVEAAAKDGAEVITGNAADPDVLGALNLVGAKRLFVAIPEAFEAGQIVEQARAANPRSTSSRARTRTPRSSIFRNAARRSPSWESRRSREACSIAR